MIDKLYFIIVIRAIILIINPKNGGNPAIERKLIKKINLWRWFILIEKIDSIIKVLFLKNIKVTDTVKYIYIIKYRHQSVSLHMIILSIQEEWIIEE